MRILLDECVPAPLSRLLTGCDCQTVGQRGRKGLQNGALLKVAELDFDIFVTSDQNIRYQQNLTGFDISVLELYTNDFRRIRSSAPLILGAIHSMSIGVLIRLEIP